MTTHGDICCVSSDDQLNQLSRKLQVNVEIDAERLRCHRIQEVLHAEGPFHALLLAKGRPLLPGVAFHCMSGEEVMVFQKAWPAASTFRLHSRHFSRRLLKSPQTQCPLSKQSVFACTWER